MRKFALVIASIASVGGCATVSDFQAYKSDGINAVRGTIDGQNADFSSLLQAIGKDRALLLNKGRDWNRIEAAFGLALLASAAYGGFNTTFDGGNLKDAAFAAASIASLKTFTTPNARRDAYYKAGTAMNCLFDGASIFADTAPAVASATIAPDGRISNFTISQQVDGNAATTSAANTLNNSRMVFNAAVTALIDGVDSRPIEFAMRPTSKDEANAVLALRLAAERDNRAGKTAVIALIANSESESQIYARRFEIVATAYMTIMSRLFDETKFAIDADKVVNDLKAAIEQEAMAENATKNAMSAFAFLADIDQSVMQPALNDQMRYAKAQAAIAKCVAGS